MSKKPPEDKLTDAQKSRLFQVGLTTDQSMNPDAEQQKADLLREVLAQRLPVAFETVELLPDVLKNLSQDLKAVAGESLAELLQNPGTDIDTIQKIKDYSKSYGKGTDSKVEHDVSLVIYLAAIAHALVYHDQKITQYQYDELIRYFKKLKKKAWITAKTIRLFDKALQVCIDKPIS